MSTTIGKFVMDGLKEIDPVAYVRFASVYTNFKEVKDFEEFVDKINVPKINKFYQNYFIELALKLAKINEYKTGENPSVGCVLTDFNNEILSTGITSINGRPHAESNALHKVSKNKNNKKDCL